MVFDYFYVEQSESYSFYRIPKLLFTEGMFEELSTEAKVLYGLLIDRIGLSRSHGWKDEAGHVYVYYSMDSVMRALRVGKNKACRLLRELENFGLIERRKQGFCKPARIFVKNFIQSPKQGIQSPQIGEYGITETGNVESPKQGTNNTEHIKTEMSKTDPILSGMAVENFKEDIFLSPKEKPDTDKDMDERNAYREYLFDRLDMEILYERFPYDRESVDAILELMLDVICSKRKHIRIAGDDKPVSVVKTQFLKLDFLHIEYVMECLKKSGSKVRNIKQYLLAALYNAPLTIQSYYQASVNHDMVTGRI